MDEDELEIMDDSCRDCGGILSCASWCANNPDRWDELDRVHDYIEEVYRGDR